MAGEKIWEQGSQHTTITNTAETTIVTASATGLRKKLYFLLITNLSATPTNVTIKDGTAGTTIAVLYVPATLTVGFSLSQLGVPQAAVNTNWTATAADSVTSLKITAFYIVEG